jgi:hypothetical protein
MSRNAAIILAAFILTGGCATQPAPSAYEVWQSKLTEGQLLTIRSAVLAAEVFNATYDHTITELADTNLVAELRAKINEARRLNRKAQSWNLSEIPPPPPEPPTISFQNHWVLLARGLPVKIDYHYSGPSYEKQFYALKVITLRGKDVMSWTAGTDPVWYNPFGTFVSGDHADLDVQDLIRIIKINRE